jgi:hypothetical protein
VRAPTAAGTGRGRIGLSGEPVERLKRARKRKNGRGSFTHHAKKRRASSRAKRGSSDGVRRRRRLGRRSGRRGPKLQTLRDPGGGFPWTTSITWGIRSRPGKKRIRRRCTSPTASGDGEKQRRRRRWNWCLSACVGVLRVQRGVQELECEFK